jgi:hypothetical protein
VGRQNKERIKRIQAGLEMPIGAKAKETVKPVERMLHCRKCHHVVAESRARQHIRECWPMPIGDDDPIPTQVPKRFLDIGKVT